MFREVQALEKSVCLVFNLFIVHSVDTSKQTDILCHSKVFIEREFLTHIANVLLYLLIVCSDVVSHNPSCPTCGLAESCEHVHSSCLTCSVGSKKTEDFPLSHREGDVVNSVESAESLYQMFHFNNVFCCASHLVFIMLISMFKVWRTKYVAKFMEYLLWQTNTSYLAFR